MSAPSVSAPPAGAQRSVEVPAVAARAWLVGIIVGGAVLRFALLSHQSFWYDEAVSTRLAQSTLADIFAGRARDLGNPPLHLILLHLWTALFGSSDASARALSATAGLASIPLVYLIARRLGAERVALLATAIFAFSPVQVYFAQEARTYTIVSLLCLASLLLLLRAAEAPRRIGAWAGFGLATFLAMYAHYFSLFFVAAQAMWLLVARRERRILLPAAVSLASAGVAYALVWLPSLLAQMRTEGNLGRAADTWYLQMLATPLVFGVGTTLLWKGAASMFRIAAGGVALACFLSAALVGLRRLRDNRDALSLLLVWLLAPVVLPLLISLTLFPFYYVRYALYAAPAFYIAIALGLQALPRHKRALVATGMAATSALSLAFYFATPVKHAWRDVAAWVSSQAKPGDVIAFDADIGETSFERYAGVDPTRVRLLPPPKSAADVRYWGTSPRHEPPHAVDGQILAANRVWFVYSDPKSGAGERYWDLFRKEWRRVDGRQFRGVDVGVYVYDREARWTR